MTRGIIPVALIIAALLLVPLFMHDAYFLHVLILIGINVMVAVSMWLLGITGLISFGQAGFMFIGAMTTALLTKLLHWPFWVALPLSAVIPALVAAPVGRLSLRVKGVYFFLVTLAFGQVVNGVFAYFQDPFGGWYGIRCAATIRMTVVLPHPGMFPSSSSIASPECSRHLISLSIEQEVPPPVGSKPAFLFDRQACFPVPTWRRPGHGAQRRGSGGAEPPAATHSELCARAWRGWRAPDLPRSEHRDILPAGRG
jgi:hypothetical protein